MRRQMSQIKLRNADNPFQAHVIKAYNTIGYNVMAPPACVYMSHICPPPSSAHCRFEGYGKAKPAMLYAGNDAAAKATFAELLASLGFEPVDAGTISSSLHLEHIALQWIKLSIAPNGGGRDFTWAFLRK